MLRWNSALHHSLRWLCTRSVRTDTLLDQIKRSTNKYHIFQLVGIHRPVLTLEHVTCAMNLLWQFHKVKSDELSSVDHIGKHPEFISLCTVVEHNIDLMEDSELVAVLNTVDSLQVDAHSSLVQRLVTEGWRRLERLDPLSLSTFAACLRRQHMTRSPLMGQIASIVDLCLDDVEDPVALSSFVCNLYAVSSPRLQERLFRKAESSLEKLDASHLENPIQLMEVLSKDKSKLSLMKKCDKFFQKNASAIDSQTICNIMRVYQSLKFTNCEFIVTAKARLMEEVKCCDHPGNFADLFVALGPIVSLKIRQSLKKKLSNFADKMSPNNLHDVLKTMEDMECTNTELIQKICSQVQKHLMAYSLGQLCSIAEAVVLLGLKDDSLRTELQIILKRHMLSSYVPSDVAQTIKAMSLLSPNKIDDVVLSKLDDIIAQCNFYDLSQVMFVVTRLLQSTRTPPRKNRMKLLNDLHSYRLKRVSEAVSLDSLILEIHKKEIVNQMETALVEATLHTCQRFIHQLSLKNVIPFSVLVLRINTQCPLLLDKIAEVTMDNLKEIHPSAVYPILRVFSYMNYEPPQGKDFFDACARHVCNNKDSLSPHSLVLTAYALALAGYFPKELIKAIFSNDFLLSFDSQLDALNCRINKKLRLFLMELNRAVCIEHPEYGVPWFHEEYCQQLPQRASTFQLL
ncbi:FAST kinase domain-containing protein 1, mitochondrial-like isoform X2 [Rana temporaria]|uniref:FAST kinase domain-containing protein 1, mitochondrial-like isoform X2 n=1 Tax=Rana temporaria TaxID=8407 RepID=UPI001AAD2522|nr:FAST kinase domain-containing protein 1, mitochondrial-like isoform X2 [Rana temporaria]